MNRPIRVDPRNPWILLALLGHRGRDAEMRGAASRMACGNSAALTRWPFTKMVGAFLRLSGRSQKAKRKRTSGVANEGRNAPQSPYYWRNSFQKSRRFCGTGASGSSALRMSSIGWFSSYLS